VMSWTSTWEPMTLMQPWTMKNPRSDETLAVWVTPYWCDALDQPCQMRHNCPKERSAKCLVAQSPELVGEWWEMKAATKDMGISMECVSTSVGCLE
jgi:hypothetical protein